MKFRKKPIVVEATQWFKNGDHPLDYATAIVTPTESFSPQFMRDNDWSGQVVRRWRRPDVPDEAICLLCEARLLNHGWIDTLEGGHTVCPGDWIITGIKGEHYPCKDSIFWSTYDPAGPEET